MRQNSPRWPRITSAAASPGEMMPPTCATSFRTGNRSSLAGRAYPASRNEHTMSSDDNILPASEDPMGDPADLEADAGQVQDAALQHLTNTDPGNTEAHVASQMQG